MDLTRRELFAVGAASIAAGAPDMVEFPHPGSVAEQMRHSANLPIRDYLVREARSITDNALSALFMARASSSPEPESFPFQWQ